jgi:hypothetical protein
MKGVFARTPQHLALLGTAAQQGAVSIHLGAVILLRSQWYESTTKRQILTNSSCDRFLLVI